MSVRGLITKNAKKVSNRAKKIAKGTKKALNKVGNAAKELTSAIAKIQRSAEIAEELLFLDFTIAQIEKYEFPVSKNKINNDPQYLVLDGDSQDISQAKTEAKNDALAQVEEFYTKKLENLNKQKEDLKDEYKKLNDNYFGLKKTEEEKKLKLKNHELEEKENDAKNKAKNKPSYRDIVSTLSFILSIILEFISVGNARIAELVDKTNDIISKATTKEDISIARDIRNRALDIIAVNKASLERARLITETINELVSIIDPIIQLLSLLPATFMNASIILRLQQLSQILKDSLSLVNVADLLISKLVDDLNYQEARLQQLGNIIDNNLENLSGNDIKSLLYGLGYLKGFDYKDFKFYIKEEEDPKFIVKGNKRRYAVALNKSGHEVLKSESSFTLEPSTLIEELKLQIDQKGLVA